MLGAEQCKHFSEHFIQFLFRSGEYPNGHLSTQSFLSLKKLSLHSSSSRLQDLALGFSHFWHFPSFNLYPKEQLSTQMLFSKTEIGLHFRHVFVSIHFI